MAASEKDIEETMKLFNKNAASLLKNVPGATAILLPSTHHVANSNLEVPVQKSSPKQKSPYASSSKSSSSIPGSLNSVVACPADSGVAHGNLSHCSKTKTAGFSNDQLKSTEGLILCSKAEVTISPLSNSSTVGSVIINAHSVKVEKQNSAKSRMKCDDKEVSVQDHLNAPDKLIPIDVHNTLNPKLIKSEQVNGSISGEKKSNCDQEPIFSCQIGKDLGRCDDVQDSHRNLLSESSNKTVHHNPGSRECPETSVEASKTDDLSSSQKLISESPGTTSDSVDVPNKDATDLVASVKKPVESSSGDNTPAAACRSDVPMVDCDKNLKEQECCNTVKPDLAKTQAVSSTVAILRATNLRRKVTPIVSFTTEDFDLFHKAIGKSQTMGSMKESLASDSSTGSGAARLTRRCSISLDHSTRRVSDLHSDKIGYGKSENKAQLSARQDQDNLSNVNNQQAIPAGSVEPIPSQPADSISVQQLFEPSLLPVQNRKLVRRKTTKKIVTRKSTKRKPDDRRHVRTPHPVDDDDDFVDGVSEVGEEGIEFSETDSENENGSSTDESDLEFESQLAEQIYSNQQVITTTCSSGPTAPVVTMHRPQRIARELLETERNYVKRLHLVDQVFHFKVVLANREHHMFPNEVVLQIFSNIKSIYQFHHDFLLPQLEKRISMWDSEPCIGDVMRKFAPFLKLYSEYVKNFDNAMNTMTVWMDKSPRLMSIVQEIQKLPECGCLSLQHHMLEPIQRVPRYELLLKDYLKHLPEDSPDREDTRKALELVMTAASHSNEAMRKMEKFRKLLDINESLGGELNLVSPTRELIKEGKIVRMSARNGDQIERYLLLFNDLFLVCKSLPLNIGQRQQYHVKSVMTIEELEIAEGDNLAVPNTFYVKGMQKSLELHTNTIEEKIEWQEAIMNVIEEYARKKRSRRTASVQRYEVGPLGWRAPVWVKDQETSMCMRCSVAFTVLRRRHHCRACGLVVCAKCSSKKVPLAYLENQKQRVCDQCCEMLNQRDSSLSCNVPTSPISSDKRKAPAILQVKGNEPSVLSGYLMMCCDKHSWQRRWFAVHKDFVLYSFKAHQDVVALTSLPLPGYQVSAAEETEVDNHERVFKVHHSTQKKIYYFQADDKSIRNRWLDVLGKVVQLEIPQLSDAHRLVPH